MSKASMFWKSIEAIGSGAREAAIRHYLGEAYDQVHHYLMPCPELTSRIACERTREGHGCLYRIVEEPEPNGTYAAVCDEHFCPTKFYTREELVRYTINPQLLLPAISRCLGLHPQVSAVADDVWQVGTLPAATERTPVLFTRVRYEDAMQRVLEALIIKGSRCFILVTPTARSLNESCRDLLTRTKSLSFRLDEATVINRHEPALTEAGRVRWLKEKESISGSSTLEAAFPTPPGARWQDLSLVFRDGHTLTARIGNTAMKLSFQEMGMEDGRSKEPNRQWRLLRAFAEERGIMDWSSRHAHPRNQKQKELLASRLSAFFGIDGEPILTMDRGKRWETVFTIRES